MPQGTHHKYGLPINTSHSPLLLTLYPPTPVNPTQQTSGSEVFPLKFGGFAGSPSFCPGSYDQADVSDFAVCITSAGLLAS